MIHPILIYYYAIYVIIYQINCNKEIEVISYDNRWIHLCDFYIKQIEMKYHLDLIYYILLNFINLKYILYIIPCNIKPKYYNSKSNFLKLNLLKLICMI